MKNCNPCIKATNLVELCEELTEVTDLLAEANAKSIDLTGAEKFIVDIDIAFYQFKRDLIIDEINKILE